MEGELQKRKVITTLFFIVLADMLGFGLIIPLLPYYVKQFGASDLMIGLLAMVYPLGQVFAAPLIGRFSDKVGRKKALLLSVGGTFLSLITLGLARSVLVVLISRLIDGLTGGNITVAQSYIGDFTDEKSRAKSLGLIGAAFGLGFILGPALGGFLSRWGFSVPAFFAAGLSFVNLLNIIFLLPDSKPAQDSKRVPFTFEELKKTISMPHLGSLVLVKLFYSLGFTMFESSFSLFAMKKLNLPLSTTSYVLAYVGLVIVFTQGFLVGKVTKKYSEDNVIKALIFIASLFLLLYSLSANVFTLLLFLGPLAMTSALIGVSLSSLVTKSVQREKLGGTLGVFNSVDSLMRIISPVLGAAIIQYLGPSLLGVFEGLVVSISGLIFYLVFVPKYSLFISKSSGEVV
ncbi:MFS transporter [Fervidobacterium islandicum]|uniref:MFS transporter n=1 Tax=Fervidobacterium islandicum TaxID=2423 RepID=A0AAI8CLM3_FERIS|nr:MFS transporter [Fervidobacterium islandicum]AMW32823.2 MFS transporter [Fervidobacterium islandicum]